MNQEPKEIAKIFQEISVLLIKNIGHNLNHCFMGKQFN